MVVGSYILVCPWIFFPSDGSPVHGAINLTFIYVSKRHTIFRVCFYYYFSWSFNHRNVQSKAKVSRDVAAESRGGSQGRTMRVGVSRDAVTGVKR
jgi:hypothetical protein